MWGLSRFDYHRLAQLDDILLVGGFLLTLLTLFPRVGMAAGSTSDRSPFNRPSSSSSPSSSTWRRRSSGRGEDQIVYRGGPSVRDRPRGDRRSGDQPARLGDDPHSCFPHGSDALLRRGAGAAPPVHRRFRRSIRLFSDPDRPLPSIPDHRVHRPTRLRELVRVSDHPIADRDRGRGIFGRGLGASQAKLFYLPRRTTILSSPFSPKSWG